MTRRIEAERWPEERRRLAEELAATGTLREHILDALNAIPAPPLDRDSLYAYLYNRGLAGGDSHPKRSFPRKLTDGEVALRAREKDMRAKLWPGQQRGGEADRPCICCGARFRSWGIGNRLCDGCKK